jgi:hypothetical protein
VIIAIIAQLINVEIYEDIVVILKKMCTLTIGTTRGVGGLDLPNPDLAPP